MSGYRDVIIETFIPDNYEPTDAEIRFRPVPGQGLDHIIRVECQRDIRGQYPIGTKFKIKAKVTNRLGGPPFLYSHHTWIPEVVEIPEQ